VNRKYAFLLVILLLSVISVTGQNLHLIDSIHQKLSSAEGNNRFDLLNDLAWEYRHALPDTTIYYSNLAFQLGKRLNLTTGLARPLNILGVAYNYKGERILAYENYNKALQQATSQNDSVQIAHANNNIGRLFFEQGLLGRSYEHFIKAKSLFQRINDSSGLAYAYQSLANLYKTQRDYKKAEDNYLKAYQIRLSLGKTRDIMSALVYLGRYYLESNNLDQSIHYFKMADSTGHVIDDKINLAEVKTYLAESYLLKGLFNEAESIGKAGLDVIEQLNNVRMRPQAYHTMGQIYVQKKDFNTARHYFSSSLEIAMRIKDLNAQMKAHYDLWKVAERLSNEDERLTNMNQYLILKDSIKDLDLARQVERLQFEIEIQRKEQENTILKAEDSFNEALIQKQRLQNIVLIVIIAFVSVLGFVLWVTGVKRRDINAKLVKQNHEIEKQREEIVTQNEKLSKRNQQLSDLNHEKDTLMSIVAHDLKSPLGRIKGISDLMEIEGGLTDDQKIYLRMTREATQAGLDLITDLLDVHMLEENVEPDFGSFDISIFLLEKINAFSPVAALKNIHLYITRVTNEEVYTDQDYLNRIMDNLLSNAIKFSERKSTIVVSAGTLVDEFWISVKDQGPGFTSKDKQFIYQKFKKLTARPTGGESSNGLGLAIVKTLVDRLKGKIELHTESGTGSEFIVRLPSVNVPVTSVPVKN
jgi:signal transduction histidine kinase